MPFSRINMAEYTGQYRTDYPHIPVYLTKKSIHKEKKRLEIRFKLTKLM